MIGEHPSVLLARCDRSVPYDLASMLRAGGLEVHEASSSAEAWSIASRAPIDVVLTELAGPDSHNLGLLRRARSLFPRPGLVALALDHDLVRAARAAGAHLSLMWGLRPDLVVDAARRLAMPLPRPQL